jgi:hypothetical protein
MGTKQAKVNGNGKAKDGQIEKPTRAEYERFLRERTEDAARVFAGDPARFHGQLMAIEQIAELAIHGRTVDFPYAGERLSKERSDALDTHLYDLHSALYMIAGLARGWQAMMDGV